MRKALTSFADASHPGHYTLRVKGRIIRIGTSQGIRIPKQLLEQSHLGEEVEIEAQNGPIVIRSLSPPRHGWEKDFRLMAKRGDDQLIDGDLPGQSSWDEDEWQW